LFDVLLSRKICPCVARLLAFVYVNHMCQIKWSSCLSDKFPVLNGVKQGGVLSPLLFTVYIDVLIKRLQESGLGCYVGNNYMGSFAYADDLVLLSPTVNGMKQMLTLCEQFSNEYLIRFNATKSKLLVYGANNNSPVKIVFQGNVVPQSIKEKHVGHTIGTTYDIDTFITQDVCNQLYAKVNLLMRQFNKASSFIIYHLFNCYALSLYGCQVWAYDSKKFVNMVNIAWRKCVRRILRIPANSHCELLPNICMDSSVEVKMHQRFIRFLIKSSNSQNQCIRLACTLVIEGSSSKVCNSLSKICHLYNLDVFNLNDVNIKSKYSEEIVQKGRLIRDFIMYRDQNRHDKDICTIIEDLCVN